MNGPESFTPDNNFIMGEAPELKNFFVAAGFNSIGIASGGGAGRALAEWIVQGEPTLDLWPVDIRRFARFYDNDTFLQGARQRSARPALHDAVAEPRAAVGAAAAPLAAVRPARRAARAVRLQDGLGAAELLRADATRRRGSTIPGGGRTGFPTRRPSTRRRARRSTIADLTSFAKFFVQGRDAEAALQRLCANDVAVPAGQTVYTGLLNARGTYESDLTVARLARRPLPARHRHRAGDARRRLDQPATCREARTRRSPT